MNVDMNAVNAAKQKAVDSIVSNNEIGKLHKIKLLTENSLFEVKYYGKKLARKEWIEELEELERKNTLAGIREATTIDGLGNLLIDHRMLAEDLQPYYLKRAIPTSKQHEQEITERIRDRGLYLALERNNNGALIYYSRMCDDIAECFFQEDNFREAILYDIVLYDAERAAMEQGVVLSPFWEEQLELPKIDIVVLMARDYKSVLKKPLSEFVDFLFEHCIENRVIGYEFDS